MKRENRQTRAISISGFSLDDGDRKKDVLQLMKIMMKCD